MTKVQWSVLAVVAGLGGLIEVSHTIDPAEKQASAIFLVILGVFVERLVARRMAK